MNWQAAVSAEHRQRFDARVGAFEAELEQERERGAALRTEERSREARPRFAPQVPCEAQQRESGIVLSSAPQRALP